MIEHDHEPVAGLPEKPPEGERILWQGKPDWRVLALRGFRLRWLALYFVVLAVWAAALAWQAGAPTALALTQASWLLGLGAAVIGLVALFARLCARNTIYTITDRRLVIRSGIALDMAVNLPFRLIDSAALKAGPDGIGDVVVQMAPPHRVALLSLWPHVRPWRFRAPQPMLRAVPDAAAVARLLARALAATGGTVTAQPVAATRPSSQPEAAHA